MAGLCTEHDKKKKIDYGKIVAKFAVIKMQKLDYNVIIHY